MCISLFFKCKITVFFGNIGIFRYIFSFFKKLYKKSQYLFVILNIIINFAPDFLI